MGIVGANGVGKTTFLKLLLGEIKPDEGFFDIGETVHFGYFSQQGAKFDPEKRVIEAITDLAEVIRDPHGEGLLSASQLLTRFAFSPERQYTPICKLSGGELRRLYLCTVLLTNPNFLVLDEPTNDLDLLTLGILEEYLREFKGCLIVVSHDRLYATSLATIHSIGSGTMPAKPKSKQNKRLNPLKLKPIQKLQVGNLNKSARLSGRTKRSKSFCN